MKFIKMIWFDIYNGLVKNILLFILPVAITIPAAIDTIYKMNNYSHLNNNMSYDSSMGNVWMSLYGGMEKYIPTPDNPFNFPVIWTIIMLIGAFLVLNYPIRDMLGTGKQYLVQGGSRKKWWISKIIWNVLSTLVYHGMIILTMIIICLIAGVRIRLGIDISLMEYIFEFKQLINWNFVSTIPITVILLPIVISVLMNLIQMLLCLFINPTYSFLVNCMLVVASALLMKQSLVYNYAIPLRYGWIFADGFNYMNGYVITIAGLLIVVVLGLLRFSRYDIIKKGEH